MLIEMFKMREIAISAAKVLPEDALMIIASKYRKRVTKKCLAPEAINIKGVSFPYGKVIYTFSDGQIFAYEPHFKMTPFGIVFKVSNDTCMLETDGSSNTGIFVTIETFGTHLRKTLATCLVLLKRHGCILNGDAMISLVRYGVPSVSDPMRAGDLLHGDPTLWRRLPIGCAVM